MPDLTKHLKVYRELLIRSEMTWQLPRNCQQVDLYFSIPDLPQKFERSILDHFSYPTQRQTHINGSKSCVLYTGYYSNEFYLTHCSKSVTLLGVIGYVQHAW